MTAHVISIAQGKGGCGKTTTTAFLIKLLAEQSKKVLAIDLDSQANLTEMITGKSLKHFEKKTIFKALIKNNIEAFIHTLGDFDLIPADDSLANFARFIYTEYSGENFYKILNDSLGPIKDKYDFILLDLPPALNEVTINALSASDYAFLILKPEPFCLDALERFFETVELVRKELNPRLEILGILTSLMNARNSVDQYVYEEACEKFGKLMFNTIIKRKTRIQEYSYLGIQNDSARDKLIHQTYYRLILEVLDRVKE